MSQAFDVTRFHELLRTGSLGRNLLFQPSVGSTMDMARDAAAHGAADGTLALADEQTAGRGRLGRGWVTPPALNLTSTLLIRPSAAALRQVAMITPLAIARAVESADSSLRPDIKWPNDIHLRGKKLAGVLIEIVEGDAPAAVLVGAGININLDPRQHVEIADIATSLLAETGRAHDREAILAAYVGAFEELYIDAPSAEIYDAWRSRLVTLGRQVHARWPGGEAAGLAEDVDDDGSLVIRSASGERVTVEAGDVTLRE
jgi:BirA family biotin operon repressor/biotin-[acetyl-CoA-carboxylase] ligase